MYLKHFQASGNRDRDTVPPFKFGDELICYIICVFKESYRLEAVLIIISPAAKNRNCDRNGFQRKKTPYKIVITVQVESVVAKMSLM